jgi:dihydrofolate reductase
MKKVYAIVAMDSGRAIGKNGDLPWHIPEDLKYFSDKTRGHAVLMGRTTWESLKPEYKPLPKRLNIVCSHHPEKLDCPESVLRISDPIKAIEDFRSGALTTPTDTLWIVGGAKIYASTLLALDELFLTAIDKKYDGDTFFPSFEQDFSLVESDKREGFAFNRYKKNAL